MRIEVRRAQAGRGARGRATSTIAATGSGLLLRGVDADDELPSIRMDAPPAGERVDNANTQTALAHRRRRARRAAPPRSTALWTGPKGMMLALATGPT